MSEVVLLLTPIHTGTHFVRLLLESHPSISLAGAEDYRIDPLLRPDTILPGLGGGCYDETVSPDREPGRNESASSLSNTIRWLEIPCSD